MYHLFRFAFIAVAGLVSMPVFSQNLVWQRLAGTRGSDVGLGVAVDGDGNVYAVGTVTGVLHGRKSLGGGDVCLLKFDPTGKRMWTRILGSTRRDWVAGVAVNSHKRIFVLGNFRKAMDGIPSKGGGDVFLSAYDDNGNRIWTRTLGTEAEDYASGLRIGSSGGIYVAGITSGVLNGKANLGGNDFFLCKYDSSGNRLWTLSYGTPSDEREPHLDLDARENLYLAGGTDGSLEGYTNAGFDDILVCKFNPSGKAEWARQFGGGGSDEAKAMAVDHQGNIYLSAASNGRLDGIAENNNSLFLVKLGPDGSKLWTRRLADKAAGNALAVDASGDLLIAGSYSGKEPLGGRTSAGIDDFLLAECDGEGRSGWTRVWGGPNGNVVRAMALDGDGFVYLVGESHDSLPGTANTGEADIYVAKFAPFATYSPSFDCSQAKSLQEKLICRSADLSALDDTLASLYSAVRKASSSPDDVKADQMNWLKTRRNACRTFAQLRACMRERIEVLRSRFPMSSPSPLEFR